MGERDREEMAGGTKCGGEIVGGDHERRRAHKKPPRTRASWFIHTVWHAPPTAPPPPPYMLSTDSHNKVR